MNLPNEITHKATATLGFTFAVGWRMFVITILLGFAMELIPLPESSQGIWISFAMQSIAMILVYWLTMHWVLQRGFGSTKIVLMEHAHYQKLISSLEEHDNSLNS
jgi:hypothetical protein